MTQAGCTTLLDAFEATDYFIQCGAEWRQINVGIPCPDGLRAWLAQHCAGPCAWIVTAHNPAAQRLGAAANARRHAALTASLDAQAHAYVNADSRPRHGDWPHEPGVCVLDMDEGLARALALRFGQAAVVAVPRQGPAQLIWSDPQVNSQ